MFCCLFLKSSLFPPVCSGCSYLTSAWRVEWQKKKQKTTWDVTGRESFFWDWHKTGILFLLCHGIGMGQEYFCGSGMGPEWKSTPVSPSTTESGGSGSKHNWKNAMTMTIAIDTYPMRNTVDDTDMTLTVLPLTLYMLH